MKTFVLSIVMLVTAVARLHAAAQLSLEVLPATYRGHAGGYNVFESASSPEMVRVRVRREGDQETSFFVTFSERGSTRELRHRSDTLNYDILDAITQRRLRDLPHALPTEVLTGEFRGNETVHELEYAFVIPPLQKVAPGLYQDNIMITLYTGIPGDHRRVDSENVQFNALVHQTADLAIVGPGELFDGRAHARTLEFGDMERGETLTADLRVRSNTRYSIVFEAENGALRHVDPTIQTTVPYELRIRGLALSLPAGVPVLVPSPSPAFLLEGERYDLSVTVFPPVDAIAGKYREVVSITLISNE